MKIIRDVFLAMILISTNMLVFTRYAGAQTGCSAQEVQTIQSYTQSYLQAIFSENFQHAVQLEQQLASTLSPACQQHLRSMNQGGYGNYNNYGGYNRYGGYGGYEGGNIYDHGGGAYSTGGVGCGPSGCFGGSGQTRRAPTIGTESTGPRALETPENSANEN